jgi:uncharacterized protein (DUF4415 family)
MFPTSATLRCPNSGKPEFGWERGSEIAAPPCYKLAKEQVTLRIDRDVLDYFQADGPGWQERINQALRKAAGK